MTDAKLETKLDYLEIVREKLALGPLSAPKHEKTFELMKLFWDEETIKILAHFPNTGQKISLADLAKKTGLTKGKIRRILDKAVTKRTLQKKGSMYELEPLLPGIFEAYYITREDSEANRTKAAKLYWWFFKNVKTLHDQGLPIFDEEFKFFRPLLPVETKEKLIKVDESVDAKSQVLPYELVEDMINHNDFFAVLPCQCRMIGEINGEPCKVAPVEMGCFITGRGAEAAGRFGWGKTLNKEEAIEYLKKTEKAGLVHCTSNSKGGEHLAFICNCCSCHCGALKQTKDHRFKTVTPSNYRPKIDSELCVECETCMKKCPMEAISHPEEGKMVIDLELCIGCGVCAANCRKEALKLEKTSNIVPPDNNYIGNKLFGRMVRDLLLSPYR